MSNSVSNTTRFRADIFVTVNKSLTLIDSFAKDVLTVEAKGGSPIMNGKTVVGFLDEVMPNKEASHQCFGSIELSNELVKRWNIPKDTTIVVTMNYSENGPSFEIGMPSVDLKNLPIVISNQKILSKATVLLNSAASELTCARTPDFLGMVSGVVTKKGTLKWATVSAIRLGTIEQPATIRVMEYDDGMALAEINDVDRLATLEKETGKNIEAVSLRGVIGTMA